MLGFSDLVLSKGRVREVYEALNGLNVHTHPSFKAVVFSDTMVVTNDYPFETSDQSLGVVHWLVEFAQDLFFRLISKDLHFRAYICKGPFEVEQFKNLLAVYGEALVHAYRREQA